MSTKAISHMSGVIREAGVPVHDAGFFVLQLLAWDKLDRQGDLSPDLALEHVLQQIDVKHAIQRAFAAIANRLPSHQEAFEAEPVVFQFLSESRFRDLIHTLISAKDQSFDYHAAIEASMGLQGVEDVYNIIPNEVADLVIRLAGIRASDSVYCPFESAYRLAEYSNRITRSVFLETKIKSPLPGLMNLLLDGSMEVRFGDAVASPSWIEGDHLKLFDVAVANPPVGIRYNQEDHFDLYQRFPEKTYYGEVLYVRHMLAQTTRRAVVVVPNSILIRTAAGERQFKVDLLQSGQLEAVISLPSSLLTTTSIPFSILVLNKGKHSDSLLFIDATSDYFFEHKTGRGSFDAGRRTLKHIEEIVRLYESRDASRFSHVANRSECEANDYNLDAKRYVASEDQVKIKAFLRNNHVAMLDQVVEIMRPQYLKEESVKEGIDIYEVSVSDIGEDGYIHVPKKKARVSEAALNKLRQLILQPNDILLTVKGSVGKVGLAPQEMEGVWLCNQSFQILRLRINSPIIDAAVLLRYLRSPAAQSLIASLSGGTGVQMIQTRDVKNLPVFLPPESEQAEIVNEHHEIVALYAESAQLQAKAKKIGEHRWEI